MLRLFRFKGAGVSVRTAKYWYVPQDNRKKDTTHMRNIKGLEAHEGYEELI